MTVALGIDSAASGATAPSTRSLMALCGPATPAHLEDGTKEENQLEELRLRWLKAMDAASCEDSDAVPMDKTDAYAVQPEEASLPMQKTPTAQVQNSLSGGGSARQFPKIQLANPTKQAKPSDFSLSSSPSKSTEKSKSGNAIAGRSEHPASFDSYAAALLVPHHPTVDSVASRPENRSASLDRKIFRAASFAKEFVPQHPVQILSAIKFSPDTSVSAQADNSAETGAPIYSASEGKESLPTDGAVGLEDSTSPNLRLLLDLTSGRTITAVQNANLDVTPDAPSAPPASMVHGTPPADSGSVSASHFNEQPTAAPNGNKAAPRATSMTDKSGSDAAAVMIRVPVEAQPLHKATTSEPPAHSVADTFVALDSATGAAHTTWTRAGAQHAEAGFADPELGWVAVRANSQGGSVHASLVAGSVDSANVLGAEIAGLHAHLAEHHVSVHPVTIAVDHGMNFESETNQRDGRNQRNDPQPGDTSATHVPVSPVIARKLAPSQPNIDTHRLRDLGTHISIMV